MIYTARMVGPSNGARERCLTIKWSIKNSLISYTPFKHSKDATIWVNTILRIALKNIAIYCCIAIFGLGPLVMLKHYTCVNNSWI